MARALLWLSVVAYVVVGLWSLLDPLGLLGAVEVGVSGPAGAVELRAMYGGLELGMAAFLLWCLRTGRLHEGVVCATLSIGGLGGMRAVAWVLAGMPGTVHVGLMALELSGSALGAWVWATQPLADDA
jgi:hypothetical protein